MEYGYTIKSELFQLLALAIQGGILPQEFEADFYRLIHPDLRNLNDEELYQHYRTIGIQEGRLASPAAHRAGFLETVALERNILEVGPFTKPLLFGANVKYFDVLDKDGLVERARSIGFPIEKEVNIDYVSPNGDLSVVGREKFDVIISSHCIEHQPDLIKHLTDAYNALRPGGQYNLIIPDKRFCFDHFIDASEIDEVIRAHEEKRLVHTIKSVYEHWALTTHSNPVAHWMGHHEDPNASKRAERAHDTILKYHASKGAYIDVHAWQFTPESFRDIILGLKGGGYTDFGVERVYNTVWGSYEFMAVLKK